MLIKHNKVEMKRIGRRMTIFSPTVQMEKLIMSSILSNSTRIKLMKLMSVVEGIVYISLLCLVCCIGHVTVEISKL